MMAFNGCFYHIHANNDQFPFGCGQTIVCVIDVEAHCVMEVVLF